MSTDPTDIRIGFQHQETGTFRKSFGDVLGAGCARQLLGCGQLILLACVGLFFLSLCVVGGYIIFPRLSQQPAGSNQDDANKAEKAKADAEAKAKAEEERIAKAKAEEEWIAKAKAEEESPEGKAKAEAGRAKARATAERLEVEMVLYELAAAEFYAAHRVRVWRDNFPMMRRVKNDF